MVVFEKHRPVSIRSARTAVTKAGFDYNGAEVAARGHLAWSDTPGASPLLLEDPPAEMRLVLTGTDTGAALSDLRGAVPRDRLGDTVQVIGPVDTSSSARGTVRRLEASFAVQVTDWSPGKDADLPPLVPGEGGRGSSDQPDGGWF